MKIRNGFVSNSSSMSSIVFPKENDIILNENDPVFDRGFNFLSVDVIDEDYSRGRNELLTTIEDKVRFYISMCAIYYSPDAYGKISQEKSDKKLKTYFEKMDKVCDKVHKLAKKYKLRTWLHYPPVSGYIDSNFDPKTRTFIKNGIRKYSINISTENHIFTDIAKLTNKQLEKFLFDKRSFAIVGGDEYPETYRSEYEMKQKIDYEYERIADYSDYEKGDYAYTDSEGVKHYHEYSNHWGETKPDYFDNDHIPVYDENDNDWKQENLPFEKLESCSYNNCKACKNKRCRYFEGRY